MKVGIVTTWFERGASYVSKAFKDSLELDGHHVVIYARGEEYAIGDPKWDYDGVTWGKKVNFPIPSYTDKRDFDKWLDKESPDVVIFNEQRWFEPVLQCRNKDIKVGSYIDYYTENMLPTFSIYDFLICNTKKHFSAFEWHQQSYYIPWGTDVDVFSPAQEEIKNKSQRVFFHSAGMNPYRKGTDLTILAFKDAVEASEKKGKLLIHTQVDDLKEFFESYPRCYNSKEINEAITWLSSRSLLEIECKTVSAPGLYFKGDIYLYPSRLDGLGLTVAEAIASGLPTIVPNDGPMNEFVIPSVTGDVCKIDRYVSRFDGYYWPQNKIDMLDFSKKINLYLNMSEEKLTGLKVSTRDYAVNNLNCRKNLRQLSEVFLDSNILPQTLGNNVNDYYTGTQKLAAKYPLVFKLYNKFWK